MALTPRSVIVTGGAGYIGTHVVHALLDAGYRVHVLDDLSTGRAQLVASGVPLWVANVRDRPQVKKLLGESGAASVIHLAASIRIDESVERPLDYYQNNVCASRALFQTCVEAGVEHFVFSSTAAVYGEVPPEPVAESHPASPISPYGSTKLAVEWMLRDVARAHGSRHVALRFFNVAGADPALRTGATHESSGHLISTACQVARGVRESLTIFGDDYSTPDGTPVRDFIHVADIASAHVAALQHLEQGGQSEVLNLGYGRGFSVQEVVDSVRRISGHAVPVQRGPRRPGDAAKVIANVDRIRETLGWVPQHASLDVIIETTLRWQSRWTGLRES